MFCPKCRAKIGLYRYEARTRDHMAQGITCSVCGYWAEDGADVQSRRKTKK